MRKIYLFLIVVSSLLISANVFAAEYQDVVYLKNGSIIKGLITEQIPGETVTIETNDGNVFVYKYKEVKKFSKEQKKGGAGKKFKNKASDNEGAFIINLLGFLQFGPQLELEKRIGDNLYIMGLVRLHGLGLASRLIWPTTQMLSGAAGIGMKYFINSDENPNGLFLGVQEQFGYTSHRMLDTSDDWTSYGIYLATMGDVGYRWRFDGFLVNLGLAGGFATDVAGEYWHDADPTTKHPNALLMYMIGMVELSIGWEY
jgi:hypothetical protein